MYCHEFVYFLSRIVSFFKLIMSKIKTVTKMKLKTVAKPPPQSLSKKGETPLVVSHHNQFECNAYRSKDGRRYRI